MMQLFASHIRAAKAAREHNLDSLGALFHGAASGHFNCPAEGCTPEKLLSDILRGQLRAELGIDHLADLELHIDAAADLLEIFLELGDLGALLADDETRAGAMKDHVHLLDISLDLDLGNRRGLVVSLDEPSDLVVLHEKISEALLVGEPT